MTADGHIVFKRAELHLAAAALGENGAAAMLRCLVGAEQRVANRSRRIDAVQPAAILSLVGRQFAAGDGAHGLQVEKNGPACGAGDVVAQDAVGNGDPSAIENRDAAADAAGLIALNDDILQGQSCRLYQDPRPARSAAVTQGQLAHDRA